MKPGDLVFDIGANYGWKTELFLALGTKIIAVEPQAECLIVLRRKFIANQSVIIESTAVGSSESTGHIWKSDVRNQLSSMSQEWIRAVKDSGRFRNFEWSSKEPVRVTTLDALIGKYGSPSFCKIDTEGYEFHVIKGLSQPVPALSIEYHVEFLDAAIGCVEYLEGLGEYSFNFTVGEKPEFASEAWLDSRSLIDAIISRGSDTLQGDVYAKTSRQFK